MIAALFDFDGTLYTGHIWQDLVHHHWTAGRQRFWMAAYLGWNMAPLPLYKAGLIRSETFFHTWGKTMGWLLRGWTPEEAHALFKELTEEQIVPNLRPDILDLLRQHQASGHLVALVSGTFSPFLETIARWLAVDHAIGTPLAVDGGRFSGRIIPPLCQGEGKPQRVQAYLAARGMEIDWTASFAYADRATDLPLLDLVRHPVAVYPDAALLACAQSQGWQVIGEADS